MGPDGSRSLVLALALTAALAVLATVLVMRDSEPDEPVIEYRNDAVAVNETRLLRAERIGRQIWGNVCHGDITVTIAPLKDHVGQATYWTADTAVPPDPATFYDCAIIVSDARRLPWLTLCQVVAGHEMGHLAGREHSPNPRSTMFYKGTKHNVPARCKRP